MTESTKIDYVSIVQDLRDEADLCRNETATDIADLLDDAASCIVAMKSQFTALRSDLAAAQEALKAAERDTTWQDHADEWQERAQRAEALAESNARDAERYRWLRESHLDKDRMQISSVQIWSEELAFEELDAAIDAAREGK